MLRRKALHLTNFCRRILSRAVFPAALVVLIGAFGAANELSPWSATAASAGEYYKTVYVTVYKTVTVPTTVYKTVTVTTTATVTKVTTTTVTASKTKCNSGGGNGSEGS